MAKIAEEEEKKSSIISNENTLKEKEKEIINEITLNNDNNIDNE